MQGGPCPLPVGVVSPCPPCCPSQQHPQLCRLTPPISAGDLWEEGGSGKAAGGRALGWEEWMGGSEGGGAQERLGLGSILGSITY